MNRRSPRKQAPADADCAQWMAGALIMAAAYILPTAPLHAAGSAPVDAEGARTDALALHETCPGGDCAG